MKQILLRVAGALMVSLACGVIGALFGLGWSFLYPAQYTSTASVAVRTGNFAGDREASLAYIRKMIDAAQSPQALSTIVASIDLYHFDSNSRVLPRLVANLKQALHTQSRSFWNTAVIDLSLTYPDRLKAQEALDKVIWFLRDEERRQNLAASRAGTAPWVSFDGARAGSPVRTASLDPEILVLLGFIAGLLVCATASQVMPPPRTQPQS